LGLRFIVGRAGTGKSRFILDSITKNLQSRPDGPPIVLLVPEQATFQMEYALAAGTACGGSIRAQVLSFRRLAHRVLMDTGGAARIPVGELGKRMILRGLLEGHKDCLRVFGKISGRTGFADCLARSIGEMKTYLVSPDELERAAGLVKESGVLLKDKITDLSFLYREMELYLENRYTDPDDYLNLLVENFSGARFLQNAEFWIDGFKGFTPQETRVLEQIFRSAAEVNIALCIDSDCLGRELPEEHLFYPTWETYKELNTIGDRTDIQVRDPVVLRPEPPLRFICSPALAHLEKWFYSYPALTCSPDDSVRIIAAAGRRAEVEACAREAIRQVRDHGYRWKDINIILRDLEGYYDLIMNVFNDHQIPVFIDLKRRVTHHPLVEVIRSALEVAVKDWGYDPVFRYLKTDMVQIDRDIVFTLENYVLAHGIKGTRWTDGRDWSYRRRYNLAEDREVSDLELLELARINSARDEAVSALRNFCGKVLDAGNVREMTTIVFELLSELKAAETVDSWRIAAEAAGNPAKGREHAQIWNLVIGLLDEVVEALGDEETDLETYAGILDSGFENLTMGMIPPGLDQVVVGSMDRSRNPEVRSVFILGASEGVLPARFSDNGVFDERERDELRAINICLSPGGRSKSFEECFLIYTALTRASERLWVSYPIADDDGRAVRPSPVINRIKEIISGIAEECVQVEPITGDETDCLEFIAHPHRALGYLTARLRDAKAGRPINNLWWELYNWFICSPLRDEAGKAVKAIFHINVEKPVPGVMARTMYGYPLKTSVSRIEKYIACPFAHFSSYGLRLRERNVFRLEAPDMGELFHASLKAFADELDNRSLDWGQLNKEECAELTERVVTELAPRLQSEILLSTARYGYLAGKLKKAVNRAALVLGEHSRRSIFKPVGMEFSFGPGGELSPAVIGLPEGGILELSGRIDRLDMAQTPEGLFIRVIDFKSSDQNIKPEDIYYGLKLQLLTYLHVALQHYANNRERRVKPGAILYFTVKDPIISSNGPMTAAEVERAILARLKMKGLILADRQVVQMMDSRLETGYSELLPVGLKGDGTLYSNSSVLDESQFELLRQCLVRVFTEAAAGIQNGDVSINPCRKNMQSACSYCLYRPVCKFDVLLEGNKYRVLPAISEDELWTRLAGEDREHHRQEEASAAGREEKVNGRAKLDG